MKAGTRLALFAAAMVAVFMIAFFVASAITGQIDGWDPGVTQSPISPSEGHGHDSH
ncbi:hypothetical protein U6G28_11275 [Actinomycetaceae bacterium MB13-C1-2]|nr:hypothetical protein U6G28_11275 [Actinomycetaceae bacterium MB13-C1-2]